MQVQYILEFVLPATARPATPPVSPGNRAMSLMMQIMNLFDAAEPGERDYIAWRMTKTADTLRFAADRTHALPTDESHPATRNIHTPPHPDDQDSDDQTLPQ